MRTVTQRLLTWIIAATAVTAFGCEEEPKPAPAPAKTVEPKPAPPPTAAAPTPPPAPVLRSDCPEGSSGEGTYDNPCKGSGDARMMQVEWTGKTDDKGPSFRVVNTCPNTILYGKIAVYFYDKAGKQLEVPPKSSDSDKARPYASCAGNIFAGVMKPKEKATITFSCIKQDTVPEGTKAIEAEMPMVGFADATEKRNEYYWRNDEVAPDQRAKGAGKAKGKKKK
jgi:hypothetical protein